MQCRFYIPDDSTTLAVMIPIPKYDDYGIYFFGWCNKNSSLPHVKRYNNKNKILLLSGNGANRDPLLIFPKMEFTDDGSKTQLQEDRFTGIVSEIDSDKPKIDLFPKGSIILNTQPISNGLLDFE